MTGASFTFVMSTVKACEVFRPPLEASTVIWTVGLVSKSKPGVAPTVSAPEASILNLSALAPVSAYATMSPASASAAKIGEPATRASSAASSPTVNALRSVADVKYGASWALVRVMVTLASLTDLAPCGSVTRTSITTVCWALFGAAVQS